MWEIKLHKQVLNFLKQHKEKDFLKRVDSAFEKLSQNPYHPELDIKKLVGSEDDYRLRIGKYRFIYTVLEDKILIYIYKAGNRGDIY
jgi:mRNA interferase RelE/StbE